jgi:hypothetical protein
MHLLSSTVVLSRLVDPWHDVHRFALRHGINWGVVIGEPIGANLRRNTELLQHETYRPMAGSFVARIVVAYLFDQNLEQLRCDSAKACFVVVNGDRLALFESICTPCS